MSMFVKNIIRFAFFVLIQVFVLDNIFLHHMATPYVYFLFILWLPFKMPRIWQMFIAFALGFTIDSFRHHPGFHAAASVLIAYIRPFFINLLISQEGMDNNYEEPSVKSMGGWFPYLIFCGVLTFIHHSWLFLLEAWQFSNIWYFLIKTLLSTAISLLLIITAELLFTRKQRFKTNTA